MPGTFLTIAIRALKVDYNAAGVFLNITAIGVENGVPRWWTHPEVKAQEGLDPRAQVRPALLLYKVRRLRKS